jgi:AcrR family transcriptional regulator
VSKPAHPPQQQRSRETLARLLEATTKTVNKYGLAGTTIPRIAQAAKVAPASVYRRFRDKEALLRAAFLDVLEHSAAANSAAIPALLKGRTLEWIAGAIARSLIEQYRAHPTFMRALVRFLEEDDDQAFRRRATSLMIGNANVLTQMIVDRFAKQIRHKDPRHAVTFIILVMANVVETRALEDFSLWTEMIRLSDEELVAELKHVFLTYLLAKPDRGPAGK